MRRVTISLLATLPAVAGMTAMVATVVAPRDALAAPPAKKALDAKAGGETIFEGKSSDGLVFNWRGPKKYDAAKGCGLTLILHGTGLDHRWGTGNTPENFRPDDLVISPDGTSPGQGGTFLFLGEPKDAKRLHQFLEEVKKAFKIRATFLYGHSQGSFFSLYYAGEFPDDVQGVVAHASGMWNWTKLEKDGHRQAIVLMHGTQDPVVPYCQSPGGVEALKKAGYPMARLYPLEYWNHWPTDNNGDTPHTGQELAWVEGMTTTDADRLDACLEFLCNVKEKGEHDWGGLYSLAKRVSTASFASPTAKGRATKAIEVVEALAKKHAEALADVKPGSPLDAKGWAAHLAVFLRQFDGVPACDDLAAKWKDTIEKQDEKANASMNKWWEASHKKSPDVAEAFDAGVAAITDGFLNCRVQDNAFRESLENWHKDAAKDPKKSKLSKKALKEYPIVETMKDAWKKGWADYEGVCKTAGDV